MDDCIFNLLPSAVTLGAFVKLNKLWFILYRTWVRRMWPFESHLGSICVAFCDAMPLSANTGH